MEWFKPVSLGITLAKLLFAVAKIVCRPDEWPRWTRERRDWSTHRKSHEDLRQTLQSLGIVIASGRLRALSGSAFARELSGTVLVRAQKAVQAFCPGAICCLKVAESEDFLRCYFPPEMLPLNVDLIDKVEVGRSYAGLALRNEQPYFVPDLSKASLIVHPDEVRGVLEKRGIKGLVVWPIRIRTSDAGPNSTVAVFKVDFDRTSGLVDNQPTRRLFESIVDLFELAFQAGLGASRSLTELIDDDAEAEQHSTQ